jgi:ATP-dependent helicase/nuclease subunit A
VIGVYESVKAAHRQLDQIDLLLKLRDLLRDDKAVRADYQALFDHVLVDEFQDTDPLQAEIILFLCEAGAVASRWKKVELAPGKLTIVGDRSSPSTASAAPTSPCTTRSAPSS